MSTFLIALLKIYPFESLFTCFDVCTSHNTPQMIAIPEETITLGILIITYEFDWVCLQECASRFVHFIVKALS